jgi:hypothetical protein
MGAMAIAALMFSATAFAWVNTPRSAHLTFRSPVTLPGVTLPAGSYIFELVPEHVDLVRVLSRNRTNVHFLGLTHAVARPNGMSAAQEVTLGEAPRGAPHPIRAWYPKGRIEGRAFIYQ